MGETDDDDDKQQQHKDKKGKGKKVCRHVYSIFAGTACLAMCTVCPVKSNPGNVYYPGSSLYVNSLQ